MTERSGPPQLDVLRLDIVSFLENRLVPYRFRSVSGVEWFRRGRFGLEARAARTKRRLAVGMDRKSCEGS